MADDLQHSHLLFWVKCILLGTLKNHKKIRQKIHILTTFVCQNNPATQPKSVNRIVLIIFITTILSLLSIYSFATDYYAVVNGGSWNAAATWSNVSCAGAGGAGIPGAVDNVTICSGITVNMNANPGSCNNLYINGGILNFNTNNRTLNVAGNLTIDGASQITGTANTRILNVVGSLNINIGSTTTITGLQLNITGSTTVNGSVTFSSNTGVKTFINLVTINSGGSWTSTSITTVSNLVFQNGIKNNGGTFNIGDATFSTNNQDISGTGAINFASDVSITGAITVTNKNINIITISGVLNGTAANSTWNNDNGSYVSYNPAVVTAPMVTGVLDCSTNSNVFDYSRNGNQNVKSATYYNLILSSGGIKTLTIASSTVSGDFTIISGVSFNPAALDFTVTGTTILSGTYADGTIAGTSNLNDLNFSGGTVDGGNNGVVNINGDFIFSSANPTIGRVQLTANNPLTIPNGITFTINNNNGIKTFAGEVSISSGGAFISTSVTTPANLVFQNSIYNESGGTFSSGGATFSTNNQDISGTGAISFANNVVVSGIIVTNKNTNIITISGTLDGSDANSTWKNDNSSYVSYNPSVVTAPMVTAGVLDVSTPSNVFEYSRNGNQNIKATTYYNLYISTGGTKTLTVSPTTVNGNLNINSGASFNPSNLNYSVTGATNVLGTMQINNNTGTRTFTGKVTINPGGSWTSTTVTTAGNLIFQNGITNNGTSFAAGSATFNTNGQTIDGSTLYGFANSVVITGINLTNNATVSMTNTAAGTLSGTGTWTQGSVGTLNYAGNTITISSFDATASGNTVDYNRAGAQTIFNTASGKYYNINFSTSGTKTLSSAIDVDGNLTIQGTAVLSASTYDITLTGNWNNTSTNADPYTEGTRTVTFDGSSAQNIFNTGNANGTVFNNVTVNNSFPVTALTLNAATTVNGTLTLQDGHIITTAANILVLGTAATVSMGATPDSSFVKGPMIQTYNVSASSVTKIFPVGKGNIMHRADLSIRQTNVTATQYIGEFFNSSAAALGYTLPGTLDRVSDIDYWDISNGGAGNVNTASVTLYYFPDDLVTDPPNLRIAKSDGAGNWIDIGGTGTAAPTGTIASTVNFTTFSKFALGNNKGGGNPLPIELASFNATPEKNYILLEWTTITENNNDFFTIEKSKDALNFETMSIVSGAGNSNEILNYSAKDYEPFQGVSYYRLKQTDFDGQYTYSDIVPINYIIDDNTSIVWWQEGSLLNLSIQSSYKGESVIEVYDYSGRLILNKNILLSGMQTSAILNTDIMTSGFYIIKLVFGNEQKTIKIIIQ